MKIQIINGPNINMLGKRERDHYGSFTLEELEKEIRMRFERDVELDFFQSNSESEILRRIQFSREEGVDAIVLNAAALTHTSIALRDALLAVSIPFVEVHISNVHSREPFRHKSFLADIAKGVVTGLGMFSYFAAIEFLKDFIEKQEPGEPA